MSSKRKQKKLKNIIEIADYYPKKIVHNTPKTENQKEYYNLIASNHTDIILGVGPSGTGKTLLAVESAIRGYQDKRFDKIVITRPAVSIDEQHGFLIASRRHRKRIEPERLRIRGRIHLGHLL